jgi:lipopolysaccharide export LptBFGC system permease protein LptF
MSSNCKTHPKNNKIVKSRRSKFVLINKHKTPENIKSKSDKTNTPNITQYKIKKNKNISIIYDTKSMNLTPPTATNTLIYNKSIRIQEDVCSKGMRVLHPPPSN